MSSVAIEFGQPKPFLNVARALMFLCSFLLIFDGCKNKKTETPRVTVAYEVNGGSAVPEAKINSGTALNLPPEPTKVGFAFKGWFSDANFTIEFKANSVVSKNIILYAKWDAIIYTVTFDTNGGNSIDPVKVDEGKTLTLPPNPTREHYNFVKWFTDQNFTMEFKDNSVVSANIILYAKWDVIIHTVTFVTNGGNSIDPVTVDEGKTLTLPPNPTREGYSFVKWFTDQNFTMEFKDNSVVSANIILYAKWGYKVTFVTNGGNSIDPVTIDSGKTLTLPPNPTREHYDFVKWFRDATFRTEFLVTAPITSDITLYAAWKKHKRVTYVTFYGSLDGEEILYSKDTYVRYGETISTFPVATRKFDEFKGWFTADKVHFNFDIPGEYNLAAKLYRWGYETDTEFPNGNPFDGPFDVNTPIIKDIVLYAKYVIPPVKYTKDGVVTGVNYDYFPIDSDFKIPDEFNGITITEIGADAFYGQTLGINSLTLPKDLIKIGDSAFAGTKNVGSPETKELKIPEGVTSIGNSAFSSASFSGMLVIPDNVKSIGNYAFSAVSDITGLKIGSSVKTIGDFAFSQLFNLEGEIVIPNSVTSIGHGAFLMCEKLKKVTIGTGVEKIDGRAFWYGCDGCSRETLNIYINAPEPPTLDKYALHESSSVIDVNIYVPKGKVQTYKNAVTWKDYENFIKEQP